MKIIFTILISLFTLNITYPQWTQSGFLNGRQVNFFSRNLNFLFAGTAQNGLYRSPNSGDEWFPFNANISSTSITGIITQNNVTYLSALGGGVFKSDSGNYFQSINGNLSYFGVNVLAVKDNFIYACMDNGIIYRTSNGGNVWSESSSGINSAIYTSSGVLNNNVFIGTAGTGIYKSTNNGNFWFQVNNGLGNLNIRVIKVYGNSVYTGTQNGLFFTSDDGNMWNQIQTNFSNNDIRALEISGSYIFAGTHGAGIYKSSNSGQNWTAINEELYVLYINTIFKDINYLFAGAGLGGAMRRPLSQVISVKKISLEVPSEFELGQNYPNPFNQSSVFILRCSMSGGLRIILYDINGREIFTLLNQYLEAGIYSIRFDAGDLPGGVYFYRMITEDGKYFSQVRKMIISR
ncbi:MAG: T9SS type A sorting domain-containing protein [Ignavibacteria bacterium]|nr:T9SS type A sorting domain-containing protein [Ignavibacteria bacterium]